MKGSLKIAIVVGLCLIEGLVVTSLQATDTEGVRTRAERSFDQLKNYQEGKTADSSSPRYSAEVGHDSYSSDRYWVGKGQGDLTKGKVVCQRVSELSARTDLAKQIRVLVKEHMIDRVRERSGRESEQDIELIREEIVQEYLQDVKIIDRRIDEENKSCTATAVMAKIRIAPKLVPDISEPTPTITR
ncbi:MAG: hypothetical protein CV088_13200 [Nitrospira sp. LK70]|nr:hypothetical protein [Nitrospira sp. LK70]